MRPENPDLVTVVGIGAGGWSDLSGTGRSTVEAADVLFGSDRQLALVPASVVAERVPWPTPLLPALPGLLAAHRGRRICVLASGDPMFHGIGATLVRLLGPIAYGWNRTPPPPRWPPPGWGGRWPTPT